MNYNQFYKKKDREKREYAAYEKKNIAAILRYVLFMVGLGMAVGLIILMLVRLFGLSPAS